MELLRKLGFTHYEARLLWALLKSQKWLSAEELVREANVPLTKSYSILITLEKRGLIQATPGKPRRYFAERKKFLQALKELKNQEIEELMKTNNLLISEIKSAIPTLPLAEEVEVKYFTNPEEYWKAYLNEVGRFKKGEIYRVINSVRLTFGLLEEEIKHIPSLKKYAGTEPALQQGVILHYILNPRAILKRTKLELKEPQKIQKSLNQMLARMEKFKHRILIDFNEGFENLLLAILPRCVCLEFYGQSSVEIQSALMIFGRSVVRDFSSWFDALCSKDHANDLEKFKQHLQQT